MIDPDRYRIDSSSYRGLSERHPGRPVAADPIQLVTCPLSCISVYVRLSEASWWETNHLAIMHRYCRTHDIYDCPFAHA